MAEHNILRLPDAVTLKADTKMKANQKGCYSYEDVLLNVQETTEGLTVQLTAIESAVKEVVLCWKNQVDTNALFLGDHWERGYGDLEWRKAQDAKVMPWYFLQDNDNTCTGYGVKVRPSAMCWWEVSGADLLLHLDVRCGGEGVLLAGRTLEVASVVSRSYTDDSFTALQQFCKCMCTDSISVNTPVYGSNNWYYAYGNSSREEILGDTAYLARMTEGLTNRPFMVIDDGWQVAHTNSYNGGPWNDSNADYGDMGQLASDMKALGVRPGIWFRPIWDTHQEIPKEWRLERDATVMDISNPEVLEYVKADIRRIADWGYELIKHDFSTFDIFGNWGIEMGTHLTTPGWRFQDTSKTTAEIIVHFYEAILEAAGNVLILGCNCIGHLGAGLMHANRTGDDTSGREWERTRKMGVNSLAFRLPQQNAFFGADADCVGITESIDWSKNRQWMEILSLSGTPFFVSVKPGTLNPDQEEELKHAYAKASVNTIIAKPLDWKETLTPHKWETYEGIKEYTW